MRNNEFPVKYQEMLGECLIEEMENFDSMKTLKIRNNAEKGF